MRQLAGHDDDRSATEEGLSRRGMLTRSAAGLGIALTGSVSGLFGDRRLAGRRQAATVRGRLRAADRRPCGDAVAARGLRVQARRGARRDAARERRADAVGSRRHGGVLRAAAATAACWSTTTRSAAASRTRCRSCAGLRLRRRRATGGTTTIEVDRHGNRVREYVSLAGTSTNCAGGRTPWDTWLTCEETEAILGKRHGYVFEVDPYDQDANRDPKPIKALGRYAHEALRRRPARAPHLPDRGRRQPERAAVPLDAAAPGAAAARRLAARARRRRRHARGDDGLRRARGSTSPDLSPAHGAGTTYRVDWVAGARPRRHRAVDAQAVHQRPDHAQPQVRGHVVGRRRRLLRLLVRPHVGRQRRPARRPGLVPRPARRHDRAQAALRLHARATRTATPTGPTTSPCPPTAA